MMRYIRILSGLFAGTESSTPVLSKFTKRSKITRNTSLFIETLISEYQFYFFSLLLSVFVIVPVEKRNS